jgi:hypothetical protein
MFYGTGIDITQSTLAFVQELKYFESGIMCNRQNKYAFADSFCFMYDGS